MRASLRSSTSWKNSARKINKTGAAARTRKSLAAAPVALLNADRPEVLYQANVLYESKNPRKGCMCRFQGGKCWIFAFPCALPIRLASCFAQYGQLLFVQLDHSEAEGERIQRQILRSPSTFREYGLDLPRVSFLASPLVVVFILQGTFQFFCRRSRRLLFKSVQENKRAAGEYKVKNTCVV